MEEASRINWMWMKIGTKQDAIKKRRRRKSVERWSWMIWWRRTNIHKKKLKWTGGRDRFMMAHFDSTKAQEKLLCSSIHILIFYPMRLTEFFFLRCFFLFIFFITSFVSVLCKLIFLRMAKKMLMVMWFILWIQLILMPYVYFLNISCSISTQCEFHYGYFVSLLVLLLFSYFLFFWRIFRKLKLTWKKIKKIPDWFPNGFEA